MRGKRNVDELNLALKMAREGDDAAFFYLSRKLQPLVIEKAFRFGGEAQFDHYYEEGNRILEQAVYEQDFDPDICFFGSII